VPPETQFKAPRESLGDIDAELAGKLLAAAGDVSLVIDGKGVIRDIAFGNEELLKEGYANWVGRPWLETVTIESRPKIEALLDGAGTDPMPRWRQVNHPSAKGGDVPVLYSTIRLGDDGRTVAVGRDLRTLATLQQRLVDAQQSMEREYARLRHAETRYRLLFQVATEAVLIVDAGTSKIVEANPAAGRLLGVKPERLIKRSFPSGFDADGMAAITTLLAGARAAGRADGVRARLASGGRTLTVSASLFRQDEGAHFLIRLAPLSEGDAVADMSKPKSRLLEVVDNSPDGFVVTGLDGRILTANRAFLDMVQLVTEEQAEGESLERWLGRPGVDMNVLTANLRERGSLRLFSTSLRGEHGAATEVEISAVAVPDGEQPCYGFAIRETARRLRVADGQRRELPHSVDQLTELVGRVSLKDLVRETTDVIERLCIEAALELTGDNRASAAELLGLSRQSLYVKLRRYGLGDLDSELEH